jgi:hypothetical protein
MESADRGSLQMASFTWDTFIGKEPKDLIGPILLFSENANRDAIKARMVAAKGKDSAGNLVKISKDIYGDYEGTGPIPDDKLAKFLFEEATKPANSFSPSQAPQEDGGGNGTEEKK